jgi:hypothetical protein
VNYGIRLRLLARAFVDAQSLTLNAEDKVALASRLGQNDLIFHPQGAVDLVTGQTRPLAAWGNFEWQLALLSDGFDVVRLGTGSEGANLADLGAFANRAAEVLNATASHFGRIPHRLTLIQEGLLSEMDGAQMDAVALRLLHVPLARQPPFEWDWRCAWHGTMRLGTTDEQTNVLATVKRFPWTLALNGKQSQVERIRVDLDFNTASTSSRGRFGEREVSDFYRMAVREQEAFGAEITTLMGRGK